MRRDRPQRARAPPPLGRGPAGAAHWVAAERSPAPRVGRGAIAFGRSLYPCDRQPGLPGLPGLQCRRWLVSGFADPGPEDVGGANLSARDWRGGCFFAEFPGLRRKILPKMVSHSELRNLFCSADAVCFDVDSTVIQEEGIDELAKFCGVEDAVSEMTRQAMGGAVPFKAALTQRLALIQPSREQVQRLLAEHPPHLTPGIRELVSRLQERNVQVFLISGGFRSIVEHVASKLNIPSTNVFANRLKFYFNGEYAGFDETQPTAESGGKGKVIKLLKEKFHFKKIVMVGDGATDMEACPPADAFIGFGGNVIRQQVKDNAEWYITDFVELLGALEE